MGAITDFIAAKLPAYLQRPMGQAFPRTFAQVGDDLRDTSSFAFKEAMLESATPDSYPFHLRNSRLQVVPGEAPTATLNVLRSRWNLHRQSGSNAAIIAALNRLGYQNVEVWSALDLQLAGVPNPFTTGGVLYQGFFFVLIKQPSPVGPGYKWKVDGKHWKTDQALWGLSGITKQQLDDLRFAIRAWKHDCSSCRFIAFDLDGTGLFDIPRWGHVNWGHFHWGAGLRGNLRVVGCHEDWERNPDGTYRSFFNFGYDRPGP